MKTLEEAEEKEEEEKTKENKDSRMEVYNLRFHVIFKKEMPRYSQEKDDFSFDARDLSKAELLKIEDTVKRKWAVSMMNGVPYEHAWKNLSSCDCCKKTGAKLKEDNDLMFSITGRSCNFRAEMHLCIDCYLEMTAKAMEKIEELSSALNEPLKKLAGDEMEHRSGTMMDEDRMAT